MSAPEAADPSAVAEMEETVARISAHKGVEGVLIMDRRGATIQSTLDEEQTRTHAAALSELAGKASSIVGMLNPDDELTFLRIRSRQREIMISPDKGFLLVVLQNPNV